MGSEAETDRLKFKPRWWGKVGKNPVFIVGQNPGKQRIGSDIGVAWEGNRSSDLLKWVIAGQDNLYLTNVCNYRDMTSDNVNECIYDLIDDINDMKPRKIICLGNYANQKVITLWANNHIPNDIKIVKLPHPSFIARFNKDREKYKRLFTSLIFSV